jgi:hypothetical protein
MSCTPLALKVITSIIVDVSNNNTYALPLSDLFSGGLESSCPVISAAQPSDMNDKVKCANENGFCTCSIGSLIYYGAN